MAFWKGKSKDTPAKGDAPKPTAGATKPAAPVKDAEPEDDGPIDFDALIEAAANQAAANIPDVQALFKKALGLDVPVRFVAGEIAGEGHFELDIPDKWITGKKLEGTVFPAGEKYDLKPSKQARWHALKDVMDALVSAPFSANVESLTALVQEKGLPTATITQMPDGNYVIKGIPKGTSRSLLFKERKDGVEPGTATLVIPEERMEKILDTGLVNAPAQRAKPAQPTAPTTPAIAVTDTGTIELADPNTATPPAPPAAPAHSSAPAAPSFTTDGAIALDDTAPPLGTIQFDKRSALGSTAKQPPGAAPPATGGDTVDLDPPGRNEPGAASATAATSAGIAPSARAPSQIARRSIFIGADGKPYMEMVKVQLKNVLLGNKETGEVDGNDFIGGGERKPSSGPTAFDGAFVFEVLDKSGNRETFRKIAEQQGIPITIEDMDTVRWVLPTEDLRKYVGKTMTDKITDGKIGDLFKDKIYSSTSAVKLSVNRDRAAEKTHTVDGVGKDKHPPAGTSTIRKFHLIVNDMDAFKAVGFDPATIPPPEPKKAAR